MEYNSNGTIGVKSMYVKGKFVKKLNNHNKQEGLIWKMQIRHPHG